jgi:hypothetical protein
MGLPNGHNSTSHSGSRQVAGVRRLPDPIRCGRRSRRSCGAGSPPWPRSAAGKPPVVPKSAELILAAAHFWRIARPTTRYGTSLQFTGNTTSRSVAGARSRRAEQRVRPYVKFLCAVGAGAFLDMGHHTCSLCR